MKTRHFILFLVILSMLPSCVTKKRLTYIGKSGYNTYQQTPMVPYLVRPGDNLHVEVKAIDPAAANIYNLQQDNVNLPYNRASIHLKSHAVNDSGMIDMPLIGEIFVEGYDLTEIKVKLQKELEQHLQQVSVFVKMVSTQVTVIGEVKKPGSYYVDENNLNLFQALSLAGDMTDLGNRKKVKILRTDLAGTTSSYVLDITDESALTSEYYFLHPHDIVYVEPVRVKPLRINFSQLALFLSAAAAVILSVTAITN